MRSKRCFLCGKKMLENGLCSNPDCIRSVPVAGTQIAEEMEAEKAAKVAESGSQSQK